MMLVASRWMMLVLAGTLVLGCNQASGPLSLPAAVGRPAEVSQGPRVGVIVTMGGGVTIVPSKGPAFPGGPDQQLLRDDSLVTAADSFVVVQLHNGHLVRLGASQRNVVEMLASFHDPAAADDAEARFVRLMTPDELNDPVLRGSITRVAGWNTRMNAAQTFAALPPPVAPPPLPASATELPNAEAGPADAPVVVQDLREEGASPGTADGVQSDAKTGHGRASSATSPSPAAPRAPEAKDSPAKPESSKRPTDKDDGDGAGGAESESPQGGGPGKGSNSPSAPQLPNKLKFTPTGSTTAQQLDLPATLKAGGAALALCAGGGAKIKGRVKDHKLVALTVNDAAKCQELVGKSNTLADGFFELTVIP